MPQSMLEAAKLSLETAEVIEAQIGREGEARRSHQAFYRDELLLANAQATIALAEIFDEAEKELPEPQAEINRDAVDDFGEPIPKADCGCPIEFTLPLSLRTLIWRDAG